MQKKIAIFTTTRAEFGIFKPLLKEIEYEEKIDYLLFVGGTHLAHEHGNTINEIYNSNFKISSTFDYLLNGDDAFSLAKSSAVETSELAHIFKNYKFDAVCLLGDRYELIPIVLNAILFRKPIIHIHGGEQTQGAIDEQIRHMITKAAHLHFVATEDYAQNIIKLGEEKHRVFNTGALAVDNMLNEIKISKKDLFEELGLNPQKSTILMTYHPVTLESNFSPEDQINNLFNALQQFDFQTIITSPNIDTERSKILNIINKEVKKNKNYHYFQSLGQMRFHNILRHIEFMIGNSSSGIIEMPFFRKPTINIGTRQAGRIMHKSIINTGYTTSEIVDAIGKALNPKFRKEISTMEYKFGNGNAATKMIEVIKNTNFDKSFLIKKLTF